MEAFKTAVTRQYVDFSSRTDRSEFWAYTGIWCVLAILTTGIDILLFGFGLLGLIFQLGTLVPTLAITVRRVRDSGLHPAWTAACLVPGLGLLPWLYFGLRPSVPAPRPVARRRPVQPAQAA